MKLTYGNGTTCDLSTTNVVTVRANNVAAIPDDDIPARVGQAFANPLDYPELASATVPGDTVAIALAYGTPHVMRVVDGIITALTHAGVEKSAIKILLAPEFAADGVVQHLLRELVGEEVAIILHIVDQEEQIALLGVTDAGLPLRLNRVLCDADLVIPVGVTTGGEREFSGTGIFPTFSDQETIGRFHSPSSQESKTSRQKLQEEVHQCDWLLGIGLALQVVPGSQGKVAAFCCGTPTAVAEAARRAYRDVWSTDVDRKAELVVATIVGNDSQQTWQNLSRALAAADELLISGGAIAICSDIAARPGPSAKRLRNAQDLADVERKLLKDAFADSQASLMLCRVLQRGTIYLKSQLDSRLVESLGFAPIASDKELAHLIGSYPQCVVLEQAQHLEPNLTA